MNDSFLEDLELVPTDVTNVSSYPVDRHVTTRIATSTPLQPTLPHNVDNLHHKTERKSVTKELNVHDLKKLSDQDTRKHQVRVKVSEKREIPSESKLKPIENKVKADDEEPADNIETKIQKARVKIPGLKTRSTNQTRRSGSCKENNQSSNLSIKENSRPHDYSKESVSQVEVSKDKDCVKKLECKETDPAALLNSIKDIVSVHIKQESSNILRVMQELHFNSQANLIKHLLNQTDELVNEMHPSKDSNRVRSLVEQNERLNEEIVKLQKYNEELQRKLEELEFLKQENITLKLKCKELSKQ
ncbi:uncharacterized protein LOC128878941 [Hylaeus volcanicus]|uniref:uncharacterized protein LOC128878941 n=1 Tax=Hylaeus volcanicus TaxID=313075 RepID=UPI0023B8562D|nr:uncharacterized protein LOC128878941 [Hylaeus volcanicus]